MGIYPIGLSGEHLDNRQAAIAGLKRWQPVALRREPNNAFDPNAIRVHDQVGRDIGFVSRRFAEWMAPLIDDGEQLEGCVWKTEVRDDGIRHVILAVATAGENPKNFRKPRDVVDLSQWILDSQPDSAPGPQRSSSKVTPKKQPPDKFLIWMVPVTIALIILIQMFH